MQWLREYTNKPIGIWETGYTSVSHTISVPRGDGTILDLHFDGDEATQALFVHDLIEQARRDDYLFVVWFISVDYNRLMEALGLNEDPNSFLWIWANTGLYDQDVQPKPALNEWFLWQQ